MGKGWLWLWAWAALAVAGALVGTVHPAHALGARYVDGLSGNDNDQCSQSQPCRSISRAIQIAEPGDTIHITPFTYREQLTIDKAITLLGAGTGQTILSGDDEGRVVTVDAAGQEVRLEGLSIRNGRLAGSGYGGGIGCQAGSLTAKRVTLESNEAGGGGAVWVGAGCDLSLAMSSITYNHGKYGAALFVEGQATLYNVTISYNRIILPVDENTSVILARSEGELACEHCTIAYNHSGNVGESAPIRAEGTIRLESSLLYESLGAICTGDVLSLGYNLAGDGSCGLNEATDLEDADPLLGDMTDNGDGTLTHALRDGSLAIDKARPTPGVDRYDQRGLPYCDGDFDGVIRGDIGAFEVQAYSVWMPVVINKR